MGTARCGVRTVSLPPNKVRAFADCPAPYAGEGSAAAAHRAHPEAAGPSPAPRWRVVRDDVGVEQVQGPKPASRKAGAGLRDRSGMSPGSPGKPSSRSAKLGALETCSHSLKETTTASLRPCKARVATRSAQRPTRATGAARSSRIRYGPVSIFLPFPCRSRFLPRFPISGVPVVLHAECVRSPRRARSALAWPAYCWQQGRIDVMHYDAV
jgi:hypothetical protein